MITLRNLSATPTSDPHIEPPVHHHVIGLQPDASRGEFHAIRVGPAGIVITDHTGAAVALPIGELIALHRACTKAAAE